MIHHYYIDRVLNRNQLKRGLTWACNAHHERLLSVHVDGTGVELVLLLRKPVFIFWSRYVAVFKITPQ